MGSGGKRDTSVTSQWEGSVMPPRRDDSGSYSRGKGRLVISKAGEPLFCF